MFLSKKRFHMKGFKGHVVNPPNYKVKLPTKPPEYTNYVRHQINKAERAKKKGQVK